MQVRWTLNRNMYIMILTKFSNWKCVIIAFTKLRAKNIPTIFQQIEFLAI